MSTYIIRTDEVVIKKQGGDAELTIENSTKDVLGFLKNIGDGRTEFQEIPASGTANIDGGNEF